MLKKKTFWQVVLAILMLALCVFFIKNEHIELLGIRKTLGKCRLPYVLLGILVTGIYIVLQGYMYVKSFRTIGSKVKLSSTILLFLKRNLVSVFLPAGGFSSLAFFTKNIEKQNINKTQIYYASYIYAICGLISVAIVAIPILLFMLFKHSLTSNELVAFAALLVLIAILAYLAYSLVKKGKIYQLALKFFPGFALTIDELESHEFNVKQFLLTNLVSLFIEFVGIAHLYIAMLALGLPPSLEIASIGYVIMVMLLIVSPFLRGMGAIEVSMTYILVQYGFSTIVAASTTLLFRFFEFWLPLFAGIFSFLVKKDSLFFRVFPAITIFFLGIINIISAITPAIPSRLRLLQTIIGNDFIYASNYLVLLFGLVLCVLSIYLLKGVKNAWRIAVVVSFLSLFGHLSKAIDYEEAILSFFAFAVLLITRKSYTTLHDKRFQRRSLTSISIVIIAVFIYGIAGFYFLDKRHFGIDFDLKNALSSLLKIFFLFNTSELVPKTHFAIWFLDSIYISGFAAIGFVIYSLLKPYVQKPEIEETDFVKGHALVEQYGKSALDYFKTYFDKIIFYSEKSEGFISYTIAKNFAMVLENPVCKDGESFKILLNEFDRYCNNNGLKAAYYRVPEESLPIYEALGKNHLIIGQEAIIDLNTFSLEGGKMKSIRNAMNKVENSGYHLKIYQPPLKSGLVQKLQQVSEEWLRTYKREELVFSQGLFHPELIRQNFVLTVENEEEKVVAFVNLIPDKVPGEGTFDLIRKSDDAPNGAIDYLHIKMFQYFKQLGYTRVNLGMAPMSGIDKAGKISEKTIKFAYDNFRQFEHYKGLREYKDKFFPYWVNKYLIYSDVYDLLQIPSAMNEITRLDDDKRELLEKQ